MKSSRVKRDEFSSIPDRGGNGERECSGELTSRSQTSGGDVDYLPGKAMRLYDGSQ